MTLSYAHVARGMPIELVGRSNALMNTLVILSTFALQYGLGVFFEHTVTSLSSDAYAVAIGILIVLQIAASGWCDLPGEGKVAWAERGIFLRSQLRPRVGVRAGLDMALLGCQPGGRS